MAEEMLVPQERYLESGVHIGTKIKTPDMAKFIYKTRQDRLYVLDLKQVDDRIKVAVKLLSEYSPNDVLVVASRTYAANAASTFAKACGMRLIAGRVIPGIFTNPEREDFCEPQLLVVCDPKGERQAIKEATRARVPVVALCDTDNSTKHIDWVIPCNNKGKKSLALIFYLLAREYQKQKGEIETDDQFELGLEEFEERASEQELAEIEELEEEALDEAEEAAEEEEEEPEEPNGKDEAAAEPEEEKKEEKPAPKKKAEKKEEKKPEEPEKKE